MPPITLDLTNDSICYRKVCLNQNIECMQLDLSKFASVQEFANNIATKEKKIDFLICNAGVGWKFDSPNITEDGQVRPIVRPVKVILIDSIFINTFSNHVL